MSDEQPEFLGPRYLRFDVKIKGAEMETIIVDKAEWPLLRWSMRPEIPYNMYSQGNVADLCFNLDPGKRRIMFPLQNVISVELIMTDLDPRIG